MVHRFTPLLFAVLAVLLLPGCSSTPEDPDEQISAEVDEVMGRDRPDYANKSPLERMFSDEDEQEGQDGAQASGDVQRRIKRLEQQLARVEQQLVSISRQPAEATPRRAEAAPAPGGLRTELGLLLGDGADRELGNAIQNALRRATSGAGVVFTPSATIEERLAEAGCGDPGDPGCLGELTTYPGTRALISIESARITDQAGVLTYRVMDTVLGTTGTARTLRLPVSDGSVPASALDGAADEMLFTGLAAADKAGWQTRAFNQRDGQWYLSAGRQSGLEAGDRLAVHTPGRTIATPGGGVAGWVPGERKALLEVTGFAGEDIAVARLVEGSAPEPQDPVLPADDGSAGSDL